MVEAETEDTEEIEMADVEVTIETVITVMEVYNRDRGGYRDRSSQNREGGFNRDRNFNREGGYNRDRSGSGNRDQGYRPRRDFDQERGYNRDHGNEYRRPRNDDDQSRRPRRRRIIKPQNPDQENPGSTNRESSEPDSDQ